MDRGSRMTKVWRVLGLALAACGATPAALAQAQMYRCGNTFQDRPCAGGQAIALPVSRPPAAAAAASAPETSASAAAATPPGIETTRELWERMATKANEQQDAEAAYRELPDVRARDAAVAQAIRNQAAAAEKLNRKTAQCRIHGLEQQYTAQALRRDDLSPGLRKLLERDMAQVRAGQQQLGC